MNASNGSYVTNEVIIDEFTDNKFILGRPRLFKNSGGYYDLFVVIINKTADGMVNHDTYKIHYEISNDGSFTVNNKVTTQYTDFDITENIGNPSSIIQLSNGKYYESVHFNSTVPETQFTNFDMLIQSYQI